LQKGPKNETTELVQPHSTEPSSSPKLDERPKKRNHGINAATFDRTVFLSKTRRKPQQIKERNRSSSNIQQIVFPLQNLKKGPKNGTTEFPQPHSTDHFPLQNSKKDPKLKARNWIAHLPRNACYPRTPIVSTGTAAARVEQQTSAESMGSSSILWSEIDSSILGTEIRRPRRLGAD